MAEQKQSRVWEILKSEKVENLLLSVLGLLVAVLGVYLIQGDQLTIRWTDFWLFDSPLKITIFGIVVLVIGLAAFVLAIWPVLMNSWRERKKITVPNGKTILNHNARVFGFIILIVLFFVLIDWPLRELFTWLESL